MYQKPHILGFKNNRGMQFQMVLKSCKGISCFSFYVKEFNVAVHKNNFPHTTQLFFFAILHHKSLANLVVEVGTSHSHQILLQRYNHKTHVKLSMGLIAPLQCRHNGHDSVSNHQPHDCLLNRLFRRRSKKTSKLCVTGLCAGNSPGTGEFPAQMASHAEYVSIWWRHHALSKTWRMSNVGCRIPG